MECESGNCGSREFHAGDDGFTYCAEGHRQSTAGLVTAAENELEPTGRRSIRKPRDEQDLVVLSGKAGSEHYVICFQLLLWKQVHSLVAEAGFPAELETVVRDLWTLRLTGLQLRLASQERDKDGPAQMFSSQGETSESDAGSGKRKQSRKNDEGLPRIIDGLCLIFAACTLLRLPVTVADIFHRVQDGDLIYYRSSQHLAPGMRQRLAGLYHHLLDPIESLHLLRLQTEALTTITTLSERFKLTFPPLNFHLVLWGWTQALLLPLELHSFAINLAPRLSITFDYSPSTSPYRTLAIPEHRLAVLMVIAIKLLHPPDDNDRFPRRPTDPSALSLHWPTWISATASRPRPHSAFRTAMATKEADVPSLSGEQMDAFIAFFGRMYADPTTSSPFAPLFPVVQSEAPPPEPRNFDPSGVEEVQAATRPVRVVVGRDAEVERPGSAYARFKTEAELKGYAREVYASVAECVGTDVKTLVRDVFAVERELDRVGVTAGGN